MNLDINNKDHRVALAAIATHTMDTELWERLEQFDHNDDPIVGMFQELQELKMQNEAMKKSVNDMTEFITEQDMKESWQEWNNCN